MFSHVPNILTVSLVLISQDGTKKRNSVNFSAVRMTHPVVCPLSCLHSPSQLASPPTRQINIFFLHKI